jgi:hypothetical protein
VSHLAGELFKMMAGANLLHVPYRGDVLAEITSGFQRQEASVSQ